MQRLLALACMLAATLCAGAAASASLAEDEAPPAVETTASVDTVEEEIGNFLLGEIRRYRKQTRRWERLMEMRLTRVTRKAERTESREVRQRILHGWKMKAKLRKRQAHNPPRKHAWLCIFRYERHPQQGWASRTGNGYYGGLQMDLDFQRTYGRELLIRKGTADRWSALEQIWVAERAYRSGRGFRPWPNTARYCGLL